MTKRVLRGWRGQPLEIGTLTAALLLANSATAQLRSGSPLCPPGTSVCASADGRGGVQVDTSGSLQGSGGAWAHGSTRVGGQVHDNGTGRMTGNAAGQATGNAAGQATGNAGRRASGDVEGQATGQGGSRASAEGEAHGDGGMSGGVAGHGDSRGAGDAHGKDHGDGRGDADGNMRWPRRSPRRDAGGQPSRDSGYQGRFGVGVVGCPILRVGVWSGVKGGGCIAVSFRFEGFAFDMETQLLYGGPTHAFDWTFPLSFVIPLEPQRNLYEGGYLRFGGSPVGVTFARGEDGGSVVRFGLFAGAGYELLIGHSVAWRVFDARLSFDMGTHRAMDDAGHWTDLGLQLGTGLIL